MNMNNLFKGKKIEISENQFTVIEYHYIKVVERLRKDYEMFIRTDFIVGKYGKIKILKYLYAAINELQKIYKIPTNKDKLSDNVFSNDEGLRRGILKEEILQWIKDEDCAENPAELNLSFRCFSIEDIIETLKSLGYKEVAFESNGWQYDFWISMNNSKMNKLKKICVTGSAYYGDLSITVT